jgi:hypothetical protein
MSSEPRVEPTPPEPAKASKRPRPPVPVRLRDLPLPPEVVPEVEYYCRKYRLRKAKDRQRTEEHFKLQYYFGGDYTLVVWTPEGGTVVAAGDESSDEFGAQFDGLSPEVRQQAVHCIPRPWDCEDADLGLG